MRGALRSAGYLLVVVAAFAIGWVRLPLYSLGPGPAREVTPLIRVEGAPTYGSSGHLVMTTVRFTQETALGALVTWIDPDRSVVGEETVYPPGLSPSEESERAISQMDQSKIDAAAVVLTELTEYPEEHGAGALVEFVGPECPADGNLYPGDVIVRIDDEPIESTREASRILDEIPVGRPTSFRVEADGETHDVRIARGPCPGGEEPLFGVFLVEPFPFDISMQSDDVGGPSAGLVWALGLYDLLTPGDLTGGRTIAVTGAIDANGNVGPIGGIRDKVVAAEEADADLLLLPQANLAELRGMDTGEVRLVPVSTFDEAIQALSATDPST